MYLTHPGRYGVENVTPLSQSTSVRKLVSDKRDLSVNCMKINVKLISRIDMVGKSKSL